MGKQNLGSPISFEPIDAHSNLDGLLEIAVTLGSIRYDGKGDDGSPRSIIPGVQSAIDKADLLCSIDAAIDALAQAVRLYGKLLSVSGREINTHTMCVHLGYTLSGLGSLIQNLVEARGHAEDAEPMAPAVRAA